MERILAMLLVRHWPNLTASAAVLALVLRGILPSGRSEADTNSVEYIAQLSAYQRLAGRDSVEPGNPRGPESQGSTESRPTTVRPIPGAELFTNGTVRRIRVDIAPSEVAELRRDSRKYVPATVQEDKEAFSKVGVHLKGSTGSFRSIDDKPGLTLSFGKFTPGQTFHGLSKIHLNNSVEDPSYLNENLGGDLFRAAGVPAPRVAYALVELNGRSLGLYVLKEGFTEEFLGLHFRQTRGNLYDAGSGRDVNEALERDAGAGPDDRADLQTLAAAAQDPDVEKRWQRLQQVLDVERFLSFMAMEVITGHRDGYCLARNNFRVYHDLDTGRMLFFPHGMDQLFGRADLPWRPHMAGLVARALLETPEGRRRYRERFTFLFTNVFKVPMLTTRVNQRVAQIRPALSRTAARDLEQNAALVKERIVQRQAHLQRQLSEPESAPLRFENGVAGLRRWQIADKPSRGKMDQGQTPDGRPALHISTRADASASWRAKVWVANGRYRFEGRVRTAGVVPLKYGKNQGAGLRVSGFPSPRPYDLAGDSPWKTVAVEFKVSVTSEPVELVCELRARQGEAWFDLESLRLVRLE